LHHDRQFKADESGGKTSFYFYTPELRFKRLHLKHGSFMQKPEKNAKNTFMKIHESIKHSC